jgi:hypothetical protein
MEDGYGMAGTICSFGLVVNEKLSDGPAMLSELLLKDLQNEDKRLERSRITQGPSLVAPVPFTQIFGFGHQFKVEPGGFQWDPWAMMGILTLAVTTSVCLRGLALGSGPRIQERR